MFFKRIWRRLRGALGVASLWGATWFAGAMTSLFFFGPSFPADFVFSLVLRAGLAGFVAGGAFSGALAYTFRNKQLSAVRTGGFVLLGAVVAGLLFPGSPIFGAVFGAAAAGVTISLAKSAPEPLNPVDPPDVLPKAVR